MFSIDFVFCTAYLADMKGYYHYCSKGFKSEILYASEEEYTAGVNRLAVCAAININGGEPVSVLAYCLMDNHFHLILHGEESACERYALNYKKLTAMWVSRNRGHPLAETIEPGHWFVSPQKLGEKIVYVLRNPVAAGMRVVPQGYRWSSAHLMFSDWRPLTMKKVSECSVREVGRICGSKERLPESWLLTQDSVWPGSFVQAAAAENCFKSVGSFMFDLNNGNIDRETEEEMLAGNYSLPDAEIKERAVELSMEYYRKETVSKCSPEERVMLARILRKELQCNHKQLARVLRLNTDELKRLV